MSVEVAAAAGAPTPVEAPAKRRRIGPGAWALMAVGAVVALAAVREVTGADDIASSGTIAAAIVSVLGTSPRGWRARHGVLAPQATGDRQQRS